MDRMADGFRWWVEEIRELEKEAKTLAANAKS